MPEDFGGKTLKLNSPAGGVQNPTGISNGPLCITWPSSKEKEIYDARSKEFIDTINFVSKDFPDISIGIKQYVEKYLCEPTYVNGCKLVERYNQTVKTYIKLNRGTEEYCAKCRRGCDKNLADQILRQVYRMSITDPGSLNKYESFTSATYGETNFKQMAEIITELEMDKNDVFVDLGSGIGSIVMQAAICSPISRAVGIEIQDIPNKYAHDMDKNFEFLMAWYGKKYSLYDLYGGSFLDLSTEWTNVRNNKKGDAHFDWKREATVIFVNNYAFSADLNLELKNAFNELAPGTRIVSTKEFCPVDFKINDRNAGKDIGSIMRVKELKSVEDGFSWTNRAVKVFLSTIDNTKLQEYYDSKSQKSKVKTSDRSSSSSPVMDELSRSKTTSKTNLKINAPTKKASKVKVEPIQDQSDPEEFNHVTSVNGKKRQRKKKSSVYNGKEALSPSERFYRDQIKAINNNPTQNGCNNFDAKIDDAWNKVTQSSKQQFREMISLIQALPPDKFNFMYEKEKETIKELSRLVKREEEKINDLRRKTERRYEKTINKCLERENEKLSTLESKMGSEEAQVMKLKETMELNQSRINAHPACIIQSKTTEHISAQTPTITTNRSVGITPKGTQQIDGQTLPPRFTTMPQSPHSVSHSPRSIKSSPSSENKVNIPTGVENVPSERLLQAGLESATYHTHISSVGSQRAYMDPTKREHFPINLTPNRTNGDINSCESSQSRSSSTYGSPRTKRPRLPSVDSNISEGIKPVQSSVIRPTNHLSTSSNHTTSLPTNRNSRPTQQMIGQQSVVRLHGTNSSQPHLNGTGAIMSQSGLSYAPQGIPDSRLYGGLRGLQTASEQAHYLSSQVQLAKDVEIKSGKGRVNGNLSVNGTTPMLNQLGFSVGTEQYLSPAGALPGYMHGIGYPVLAGHHPYQVQYPPHHHPVSIPSRVPPHTNQTQNNAKLSKASKDVAR